MTKHLFYVILEDSYREGTTDIARVLHFGKPSKEHRRYYTLVLKGHLGLGRAVFPKKVLQDHSLMF